MKKFFAVICAAMLLLTGCGSQSGDSPSDKKSEPVELHVAAAASLTDAMKELAKLYQTRNQNIKIIFNFGSSGALEQAIENGGQADLFFSAAQKQMNMLADSGELADGTRRDLLRNEVVLIAPANSSIDIKTFDDLAREDIRRVALGEPKGVPVGQYSEEILNSLKILDAVKSKAVYGSDVRQVLAWVETGEADCGIVYATDAAVSNKVKVIAVAPEGSHKPVIYPAAVIKSSKNLDAAKKFLDFTASPEAKNIFEQYGFAVVE